MNGISRSILVCLAATQLVCGCAVLERTLPSTEASPVQIQRVTESYDSLRELDTVDAYIKLNNSLLGARIREALTEQAAGTEDLEFNRLRVRFADQLISLDATLQIANGLDEPLQAALGGDIVLTFSGKQLNWLPRFNSLRIPESGFIYKGKSYPQATAELEKALLNRANKEIADAVIVLGRNVVGIDTLPLGRIEVGVALTNFHDVASTNTHALGGVFTVAGSSILIEPAVTSIAADLEFIPNISDCPADLDVSRSAFVREIRNREPFGITRWFDGQAAVGHFYTEISGATRSAAVVHYWFADGRPVHLEELPVEPSYRWRTWSSMTIDPKLARHWEVVVVEKETGCILHSLAIRANPSFKADAEDDPVEPARYADFRDEFEQRVATFPILGERPDVALIEIPRPFLRDALDASLKDIQILVDLDVRNLPTQEFPAILRPFRVDDITCEERECHSQRVCETGFSRCTRQRDTRDCSTCLFRNPLNNRCVNEGTDPICEAARTAQNQKYDTAHTACVEREASARRDCERLRTQEIRSCEIEAASAQSACAAGREAAEKFSDAARFAEVSLGVKTKGGFAAVFSGFQIEGDLAGMRQRMGFGAALEVSGVIRFAPDRKLGPLADCINAWQKSFDAVVVLPQSATGMIGTIRPTQSAFVTDWTGYVVTASIAPTPLEALFVENPRLLADCQIGLTVGEVAAAIAGPGSGYVAGRYDLEIQPAPSRIDLARASVTMGDDVFTATPELSRTYLKYEVRD